MIAEKSSSAKGQRKRLPYHGWEDSPVLQIMSAYRRMSKFYRPAAYPEDLTADSAPPDKDEYKRYLRQWQHAEDTGDLVIFMGCCDFETRPSAVYAIEAARAMNAGRPLIARRLLRLALDSLDEAVPVRGRRAS